jgi:hypothetical protein
MKMRQESLIGYSSPKISIPTISHFDILIATISWHFHLLILILLELLIELKDSDKGDYFIKLEGSNILIVELNQALLGMSILLHEPIARVR